MTITPRRSNHHRSIMKYFSKRASRQQKRFVEAVIKIMRSNEGKPDAAAMTAFCILAIISGEDGKYSPYTLRPEIENRLGNWIEKDDISNDLLDLFKELSPKLKDAK